MKKSYWILISISLIFSCNLGNDNEAKTSNDKNPVVEEKATTEPEHQIEKKEVGNNNLVIDGSYEGYETCTCCGENANKPAPGYQIEIKNLSPDKIIIRKFINNETEITATLNAEKKLIIDQRNDSTNQVLLFWGTVEVTDKREIKLDVEWTNPSGYPRAGESLNHCIGIFKKL